MAADSTTGYPYNTESGGGGAGGAQPPPPLSASGRFFLALMPLTALAWAGLLGCSAAGVLPLMPVVLGLSVFHCGWALRNRLAGSTREMGWLTYGVTGAGAAVAIAGGNDRTATIVAIVGCSTVVLSYASVTAALSKTTGERRCLASPAPPAAPTARCPRRPNTRRWGAC